MGKKRPAAPESQTAALQRGRRSPPLLRVIVGAVISLAIVVPVYSQLLAGLRASSAKRVASACAALDPEPLNSAFQDFTLPDLNGKAQRLSASQGKVVLLHFWATWCPPCVDELPSLVALRKQLGRENFELVTVSVDDSAKLVRDFLKAQGLPEDALPVLLDPSKQSPTAYGTEKFPESYLIDPKGRVRYRFINKRDWSDFAGPACMRSLM